MRISLVLHTLYLCLQIFFMLVTFSICTCQLYITRILIKFCVENNIKWSEVVKMVENVFGVNDISKPKVEEWNKCLKHGHFMCCRL